ncbi:hypothetical protein [Streptomyces sp. NPDC018693]|uniref:hypothetical protein n=1 Tax=unclassified Streptomyces TaxID=2593676 RepID=UPI003797DFDC
MPVFVLHADDECAAAAHFHEAVHTRPAQAPGGPSRAVSLAVLAVAQCGHGPKARPPRHAASPGPARHRNDAWSGVVIRCVRAFADDRAGRSGRALHRARRAPAAQDLAVPPPLVGAALRCAS